MSTRRPPSSADTAPRCLIWIAPGYDMPLDLLDGLRQRGVPLREVHHAPLVMAELAVGSPGYDVLVVVDPEVHAGAEALVEAVRAYFPHIRIWRHSRSARVRLARWNGRSSRTDEPGGQVAHDRDADRTASAPEVTHSGSAVSTAQSAPNHANEPTGRPSRPSESSDGLLSEEELAMLLGSETFEEPDAESPEPNAPRREGGGP